MTTTARDAARVGPVLRNAMVRLLAAGLATARQDAEMLLAHVLDAPRVALLLDPGRPVGARALARAEALLARRAGHEPLQYILGGEKFRGLRIAVGPGVFIPRPETELLVERALAVCPEGAAVALDLCAGSGVVACGLARERPRLVVWAVELSPQAAAWGRINVERLGVADRVRVLEGDLFGPLAGRGLERACDLVVANPPYIARPALAALPEEVRDWEPVLALDGGPDGVSVIGRILTVAPAFARPGGRVLLEIGHDHASRLRAHLAGDARYGPPAFHRDLLGHERVLELEVR